MQMYSEAEKREILRKAVNRLKSEGKEFHQIAKALELDYEDVLDLMGED